MYATNTPRRRSPLAYFGLVFALTIPLWAADALIGWQVLPGIPLSGFAFLCPAAAAGILVRREKGAVGMAELLKRSFDFRRIGAKAWLVPVILLEPGVMALSYAVMRLTGVPIPLLQISLWTVPTLFVAFFAGALGEELGWSGYVADPLQDRYGALRASLLIGVVWAIWHFIGLLDVHRSLAYIAWWSLGTVALRVIIVWLYNNTGGSVFVAAVYHATVNLTWQLFPVNGSYYDPQITGLILAVAAILVVVVWGPRALSRRTPAWLSQASGDKV